MRTCTSGCAAPQAGPNLQVISIAGLVMEKLARYYQEMPDVGLQLVKSRAMISSGVKKLSTKLYSTMVFETGQKLDFQIPGFVRCAPVSSIEPCRQCAVIGTFTLVADNNEKVEPKLMVMPVASQLTYGSDCTLGWMVRPLTNCAEKATMEIMTGGVEFRLPSMGADSSLAIKMCIPSLKNDVSVEPEQDRKGG